MTLSKKNRVHKTLFFTLLYYYVSYSTIIIYKNIVSNIYRYDCPIIVADFLRITLIIINNKITLIACINNAIINAYV